MKSVLFWSLAFLLLGSVAPPTLVAEEIEIRRSKGGFLQLQTDAGLNWVIRPGGEAQVPGWLSPQQSFALGDDFERSFFKIDGSAIPAGISLKPGEPPPRDVVSIEPVLIGTKRAGIQFQTHKLDVLFASVGLMSDQSWITTHRDQDLNSLVLVFGETVNLNTARTSLWVSLIKTQQIALAPTGSMDITRAEEFHRAIGRKRGLPTASLSVLRIPDRRLAFGDRQVVLLEEAK